MPAQMVSQISLGAVFLLVFVLIFLSASVAQTLHFHREAQWGRVVKHRHEELRAAPREMTHDWCLRMNCLTHSWRLCHLRFHTIRQFLFPHPCADAHKECANK